MAVSQVFLLSPARCDGKRAQVLLNPGATFSLAEQLRAGGAPLGDVFSFLSGLYFRGKLTYARRFGRRAPGAPRALVITTDRGLMDPAASVSREDLMAFSDVDIGRGDERYIGPLRAHAEALVGDGFRRTGRHEPRRPAAPLCPRGTGAGVRARRRRNPARQTTTEAGAHQMTRRVVIPQGDNDVELRAGTRRVKLTNLGKVFWPDSNITKRDLLQYYADVSPVLLPHLKDRAMVMKRYPNGARGKCFFMKRAPSPRPEWIETCAIEHDSGSIIDFPMVQDVASLLWVVNLGCIDLNQWYARCDDVDRPDYLHFDLDPVKGATFERVLESALIVRDALKSLGMQPLVKTTGSSGVHIYVAIVRGPTQKQVWTFAKALAKELAGRHPRLLTAEYIIAKRPRGRVLVDYNQNAWGRTLASIYSPRPKDRAPVSTPVTWDEVERGIAIDDFRIDNVPQRIAKLGDLWKPLLAKRGRFRLEKFL